MDAKQSTNITNNVTSPNFKNAADYAAVLAAVEKKTTSYNRNMNNRSCAVDSLEVKQFMRKYPITRRIRKRVETYIVQDAARELLKMRTSKVTTGRYSNETLPKMELDGDDVGVILELYNTIGYTCVTRDEILIEAYVLERSQFLSDASLVGIEDNYEAEEINVTEENCVDDDDTSDTNDDQNEISKNSTANVEINTPFMEKHQNAINQQTRKKKQRDDNVGSITIPSEKRNTSGESTTDLVVESDLTNLISHGAEALEWQEGDVESPTPLLRKKGGRPKGSFKGTSTLENVKPKKDPITIKAETLIRELTTKAAERMLA